MNFNIGLSALRASQFAINTVSQNLANANTPGYHRQRVILETRPPQWIGGHHLGNGVDVNTVDRIRNQIIESSYTNSISDLKGLQQNLSINGQIETLLQPGEGSIHQVLGGFFDELSRLSANPSESVQRNSVIQRGVSVAQQTRDISTRLDNLKTNVNTQINVEVKLLNKQIAELVDLQQRIKTTSVEGATPNDLLDQRDQLINQIAEKIDVQRYENVQGGFGLTLAGNSISLGTVPIEFSTAYNDDGSIRIQLTSTEREIKFGSGSIAALTETYNITIGEYKSKIDEFAQKLIREVDQAHAKGVGINGPYSVLASTRDIGSTSLPIAQAGLAFPVAAGELFFSVTDPAGGKRTYSIDIDPAVDSLEDIASRISSIDHLQGVVDSRNGQLSVIAQPGFRFDFTGNLETTPDLSGFSGTAIPQIGGKYEGDRNRQLSVAIVGSGTVGKTPGLLAQVTDSLTGTVIAEVNIGEGYEAKSPIAITEGVTLSFAGDQVIAGESFQTALVANSDTTGILSALGLNNFFDGHDSNDIQVSTRILENPDQLATSRSGDIADTSNLTELLGLREKHLVGSNQLTFQDYLGEVSAEIGFQVRTSQFLEANVSELNYQYESEIAAVSGVDLNEEMLNLAQYQKQYEAAVQVMRTIDNMVSELFTLIR